MREEISFFIYLIFILNMNSKEMVTFMNFMRMTKKFRYCIGINQVKTKERFTFF